MRAPLRLYGTPLAISPLNLFREDYDVIHCNFPSPYFSALFSWFGKARGIPTVLTWHNDLPRVTSAAGLLVRTHDLLSPSYLVHYRRIIATTEVYAKTSRTLRSYAHKVRIVPNGVDIVKFSPGLDGQEIRDKHGLDRKTIILFVGALTLWHSYKGLDDLVKAFGFASHGRDDLVLLVVGAGTLLPFYMTMARELSLADKVVFAGRVDEEMLPYYYAACDFAVLPSKDRSEGFGLVLLEAMASGKPVIGTATGGITEVVHQGENGLLVRAGDVESLANAITILSNDADMRIREGKNGRRFAEEHSWSRTVRLTKDVYEEI